ncbi:MAG: DUF6316 family protein [Pseudomonadales bacterium]|jgi:hypothetical protein
MSNQPKRQSDPDLVPTFDRTDQRVFQRGDQWFFSSREGDMGPYDSRGEAAAEAEAYVALIDLREEDEQPVTPDLPEDENFV